MAEGDLFGYAGGVSCGIGFVAGVKPGVCRGHIAGLTVGVAQGNGVFEGGVVLHVLTGGVEHLKGNRSKTDLADGNSGDILVTLDQGCVAQRDFTTGETKAEEKKLDWKLSPRTAVRIYRGKTSLGNNLSVTVLTFDARGQLKNRCAFTEHCMEINSGELGPASEEDRAELVKNAGNATKVEEVEAVDTEAVEAEATTTESVVE